MKIQEGTPVEFTIAGRWQCNAIELGGAVLIALSVTHARHGELNFLMSEEQFAAFAEQVYKFAAQVRQKDVVLKSGITPLKLN